jgi:hypothetical protein
VVISLDIDVKGCRYLYNVQWCSPSIAISWALVKEAGSVVYASFAYCGVFNKGGCASIITAKVGIDAQ